MSSLTIWVADGVGTCCLPSGVVVGQEWSGRVSLLAKQECSSIREKVILMLGNFVKFL